MQQFRSDTLELAYETAGPATAERTIVLVHGFGSTHKVNWVDTGWAALLEEAGYRVLLPDGRGHGASATPHEKEPYALEAMADDLVALLDAEGVGEADLMGYSMGAMVSLVALMRHGERFRKAVAAGIGEKLIKPAANPGPVIEALLARDPAAITDPEAKLFRVFADQNGQDRQALALCFAKIREGFPVDGLATIATPTLIVTGETDTSAGSPVPLAAAIPGAETVIVPRRDHMKTVGDKAYKQAVLAFLDS